MIELSYEDTLALDIQRKKLTGFVRQYHFNPQNKKFSFDFANVDLMLAVEVEGGLRMYKRNKRTGKLIAVTGKHTSVSGFTRDCAKYNEAMIMGWHVLRVTGKQVENALAIGWIEKMVVRLTKKKI